MLQRVKFYKSPTKKLRNCSTCIDGAARAYSDALTSTMEMLSPRRKKKILYTNLYRGYRFGLYPIPSNTN
jgi:hypothetical protein